MQESYGLTICSKKSTVSLGGEDVTIQICQSDAKCDEDLQHIDAYDHEVELVEICYQNILQHGVCSMETFRMKIGNAISYVVKSTEILGYFD